MALTHTRADEAIREAIELMHADTGTLHLRDGLQPTLLLAASFGPIPPPVLEKVRVVPWGKGMAGVAAEQARPVSECNLQTSTSSDVNPGARLTGMQGAIVVPLIRDGRVVGTLGVGCVREHDFTDQEIESLQRLAAKLAHELIPG